MELTITTNMGNLNSSRSTFQKLRFVESGDEIKLVVDQYQLERNELDIPWFKEELEFDVMTSYNKTSKQFDGLETVKQLLLAKEKSTFNGDHSEDFWPDLTDYHDAIETFMYRYVYLENPYLIQACPTFMGRWKNICWYVDDLQHIEKMASLIDAGDLMNQLSSRTLKFGDGKKLKSVVGLPIDIIQELDKRDLGGFTSDFQMYISKGYGSVDEIRKMFSVIDALGKISRKRNLCLNRFKFERADCNVMAKLMKKGFTITQLFNAVIKNNIVSENYNIDFYSDLGIVFDTITMQEKAGMPISKKSLSTLTSGIGLQQEISISCRIPEPKNMLKLWSELTRTQQ